MAQARTSTIGDADTLLALLTKLIGDERNPVAYASVRFEIDLAKSDKLKDDDVSLVAKMVRDKTNVDEARLNEARVQLAAARDSLATYSVAKLGSAPRTAVVLAISKSDDDEVAGKYEKKDKKMLKRKRLAPKDGRLDKKGIVLHSFRDRHRMYQHLLDMFWKLRGILRDQIKAPPLAMNEAERSKGVRRADLPDPEDYD
jgi:hypothetical protein